jgi:hypothetical protein
MLYFWGVFSDLADVFYLEGRLRLESGSEMSCFFKILDDGPIHKNKIVSVKFSHPVFSFCLQMMIWRCRPWFRLAWSGSERSVVAQSCSALNTRM